ncbi:hypothetical protein MBLNU457_g2393t2 [Dothideomycetes sp. NU457]
MVHHHQQSGLPPQHQPLPSHQLQYQPYFHPQQPIYTQSQPAMAFQYSEDEFAKFQELSNNYQPEAIGPLLGHKQPSTQITEEYAAADPVYRTKTAHLPRKYSSYRTTRGDAIAFGYYESLLRIGDHGKFAQEEARLKSLRNTVEQSGQQVDILEDFEDAALSLLKETATTIGAPDAEDKLVTAFNDDFNQNYIITYFRMLTAAWIRTRPDHYAPFVAPHTVEHYCDIRILAQGSELDDIGINAIADILLKPAGLSLEIIYLDRSEGEEANVHHHGPMTAALASIRLLYRPGHYDLLYKNEDVAQVPAIAPTPLNVPAYQAAYPSTLFLENESFGVDTFAAFPFGSLAHHDQHMFGASLMPALDYPPMIPSLPSVPAAYPPLNVFEPALQHEVAEYGVPGPSNQVAFGSGQMPPSTTMFRPSYLTFDPLLQTQVTAQDQEFQSAQFRK